MSKIITIPTNSKLTNQIITDLDHLISFSSPQAFRKSILEVYQQYIISQHEMLPSDFENIACDFYMLIDFFMRVEEGIK